MGPLVFMSTIRFEAKHQHLKKIIQLSRNFVNVTKTITERHQTQLTFKNNTYLYDYQHGKKVPFALLKSEREETELSIILNNFPSQNELFVVDWFRLNNYVYKKGLFILFDRKFLEIECLYIFNHEEYLLCSQWSYVGYDDFLNSVQIRKSESNEKELIHFADLKQKQLFDCKSIDHKFFIIADTLVIKDVI